MKTITKLAWSNNRKNRTRSVLIMLSIFLTTVLLSAIATFGYGQIRFQSVNAEEFYGSYYGTYVSVTGEQIAEMQKRSEFDRIGRTAVIGEIENTRKISMIWMDEETIRLSNMGKQLQEGTFPQQENEIAGQESMFERLGYPNAKPGDTVTIPFRRNIQEKYQEKDFTISGIMKPTQAEQENQSYTAYVSKACYEELYGPQERVYNIYFTLSDTVSVNSSDLEATIKELAQACGINPEYAAVNGYYSMWVLDPGAETMVGCAAVALIVIFFAVLVIYNIFQVGLVQKIQEYGKIRALGATRKQMKKLVFREGMMLALVSIPAGLAVGTAMAIIFMNTWLSQSAVFGSEGAVQVNMISIPLLLICAAAALLTVWIALKRPMKMVSRISPIEAVRFQGDSRKNHGLRKGKKQMSVHQLTTANMAMNRKRTIVTIISMGLSCVLFVVVANFTGNISTKYDARKQVPYGQFQIDLSYNTNDTAYPENNLDSILKNNPLDETLVEKIKELDGVTDVKIRYMMYTRDQKGNLASVGVLNREQFEDEAYQGSLKGEVDYDQAAETGNILYGWSYFIEDSGYDLGDTVTMTMGDAGGETEFQGIMSGAFGSTNYDWIITDQTYEQMGLSGKSISTIWVDCDSQDCGKIRSGLEGLLADKQHYELSSYQGTLETSKSSLGMFETLAYGFLFLVGLIAFMNMANTMIISIITRKQELGVMQALGMTNRQMNRMLRNEGVIFTLGSILVSLIVGMPAGYAFFRYGREHGFFGLDVYHIPFAEIIAMVLILSVLQISLSYILSRNVKRESIVERIRYQE